jgi:hypothetical protein
MSTEVKAIETRYQGYRFRSRLEARWAVFFHHWFIWHYEHEGFVTPHGCYLPDFAIWALQSDVRPSIVEIKPKEWNCESDKTLLCLRSIHESLGVNCYVVAGDPCDFKYWYCMGPNGFFEGAIFGDTIAMSIDLMEQLTRRKIVSGQVSVGLTAELVIESARYARAARFEHGEKP